VNVGAEDDDGQKAVEQPKKVKVPEYTTAVAVEVDATDLHAEYMAIWNEYKSATNTEEATKFHPSRWKNKDAKSYEYAIKSLSEKLETLKLK